MDLGSPLRAIGCGDDAFAAADPSGRYVCEELLERDAVKTVHKAFDTVEGMEVAWMQVSIDEDVLRCPDLLQTLDSQLRVIKSLKHQNIMKVYRFWIDFRRITINIVTELFTSGSLRQYRRKHKNVDQKAIKKWARQVLAGLHYLHTHIPSMVLGDLTCDNIFVNGNTGVVKFGHLGLATLLTQAQHKAEFMAPELYEDEDYNELVDIYSFGMCMLEMVTGETPYCECKNSAQIYKKVISGIKPASLSRVDDPQVRHFIDKCLVSASMRLPAAQLLKHPFLATENYSKQIFSASSELSDQVDNLSSVGSTSTKSITSEAQQLSPSEFHRFSDKNEFRIRGEKNTDNTLSLTMHIVGYVAGGVKRVEFPFYLDSDTSSSVAEEMIEELDLPHEDVGIIADLIDSFVSVITLKFTT